MNELIKKLASLLTDLSPPMADDNRRQRQYPAQGI